MSENNLVKNSNSNFYFKSTYEWNGLWYFMSALLGSFFKKDRIIALISENLLDIRDVLLICNQFREIGISTRPCLLFAKSGCNLAFFVAASGSFSWISASLQIASPEASTSVSSLVSPITTLFFLTSFFLDCCTKSLWTELTDEVLGLLLSWFALYKITSSTGFW